MRKNVSAFCAITYYAITIRGKSTSIGPNQTTFDSTAAAGADRTEFEPQIYMWKREERKQREERVCWWEEKKEEKKLDVLPFRFQQFRQANHRISVD